MSETSLVFRRRPTPPESTPDATLAARLRQQVATEQRSLAYLLSGMPFIRRWHRLCRNIEEHRTIRRHEGVRAMADALVAASFPANVAAPPSRPAPRAARHPGVARQGSGAVGD